MDNLEERVLSAPILIVDDNPTNVILLEGMLDEAGYTNVHGTTDPRTVFSLYGEKKHDLVLLDIRMPYLDGFQVMEQLSAAIEEDYLPVLVLTAQTDHDTRIRALEAGAKDFVTKPFEHIEVLHRIRNMLEVRLLYNDHRRQNEILEAKVRERTRELMDTRLEIIRRLGRAAEYRDNETGRHVIRMSKYSQIIALAAGLGEKRAEAILNASPMHDVGKIGISDTILLKPGRLDPEEFEIMKTHAAIGGDILAEHQSDLMLLARSIALTHHEKWDGSGYPGGLKGGEIPIEGRISAIADVFDALTSRRPYKEPWSMEKAVGFINEQAGRHFDPDLVRVFNQMLDQIDAVRTEWADEEG